MTKLANPYEAPVEPEDAEDAGPFDETQRTPFVAKALVSVWVLEGGLKAFFVIGLSPPDALDMARQGYLNSGTLTFLLAAMFILIETIGPWIGVYYLTGARMRNLGFETAIWRTIKAATLFAGAVTLAMFVYFRFVCRI